MRGDLFKGWGKEIVARSYRSGSYAQPKGKKGGGEPPGKPLAITYMEYMVYTVYIYIFFK